MSHVGCIFVAHFLCRTVSILSDYIILKYMRLIIDCVDCLDRRYCGQKKRISWLVVRHCDMLVEVELMFKIITVCYFILI
jgi:hypothetical protein